ncbi:hypothetical protein [Paenibacillus wenxiniae]|uniref:Antitoxin VbhA domain-containing protein n=1 Tax=Paenibacillus wenxiniae TaxID=1636843 RepID=A0ABW4RJ54_9BACL
MKRFTSKQAERALKGSKAALAVEGIHLTEQEEHLIKKQLTGKLSEAEFKKIALEMAAGVKV